MQQGLLTSVFLMGCGFVSDAQAHPHVYVDASAGFIFDENGDLSALRVTWTYDAFTSLSLLDILDLDKDRDGILSDADLAVIVQAQTVWPDDFEGDTYLEAGGEPIALARPLNGLSAMTETQISVSFDLPLIAPIDPTGNVILRLYDPYYYNAYSTVSVGETGDCRAEIEAFEPDEDTSAIWVELSQLAQDENPANDGVGRLFADEVKLLCD